MSKKVVIDPGHGGNDSGTVGFGLQEKDINLDIALQLRTKLAHFADVTLTRSSDIFISLSERAAIANKLAADFFISIHVNAGGGTGFESYVYINANEETEHLHDIIHKNVADFYKINGFIDRGQKNANFAVLRLTNMPAVLLENLFIDEPTDVAKLKDARFRTKISEAISTGVIKSLNLMGTTPLPIPQPTIQPSLIPNHWAKEDFQKLIEAGLVQDQHNLDSFVTWGELSATLGRLLDKLNL